MKFKIHRKNDELYLTFDRSDFVRLIEKAVIKYLPIVLKRTALKYIAEIKYKDEAKELVLSALVFALLQFFTVAFLDYLTIGKPIF